MDEKALFTEDTESWLLQHTAGDFQVSEERLNTAREIAFEGWCQRAKERGHAEPVDLAGACKFSSLLVKALFGGELQGSVDHQYNLVDGKVIDLNAAASDVQGLIAVGKQVYRHDETFFGNEEHIESMIACLPRISLWATQFAILFDPDKSESAQSDQIPPKDVAAPGMRL